MEAIAGRIAFLAAFSALVYGSFFHPPRIFTSTHVAHFAGFFIFTLATTAAAKRTPLITVGCFVAALAILLEIARALIWLPLDSSYLDWVGDMAGVVAALGPMLLQKIRSGFTP